MTFLTRAAGTVILSGLLASSAFAASAATLPAGKPAGIKQAVQSGPALIWIGAAAVIAVTVAVVASDNDKGAGTTTTSTTGTP